MNATARITMGTQNQRWRYLLILRSGNESGGMFVRFHGSSGGGRRHNDSWSLRVNSIPWKTESPWSTILFICDCALLLWVRTVLRVGLGRRRDSANHTIHVHAVVRVVDCKDMDVW
jgi:hypothetical protein